MLFINSAVNKQILRVCGGSSGEAGVVDAEVNKKGICCQEGPSVALHIVQERAHHVWGWGQGSRMLQELVREDRFQEACLSQAGDAGGWTVLSQRWGHHREVGK